MTQLDTSDARSCRDEFGAFVRRMGGYLNSDALGGNFGESGVCDNAKLNFPNTEGGSRFER